jgi:CRP-like cAMP-binding protein
MVGWPGRGTTEAGRALEDVVKHKAEDLLARVPLFEGLSKKELKQVSALGTPVDLRAGRELTRQGARGHEFLIVLEGTVDVIIDGEVVASPEAGQFYGEIALLEHQPRSATVVATSDVTVEVIGQRDFAELLADYPAIAERVHAAAESYR